MTSFGRALRCCAVCERSASSTPGPDPEKQRNFGQSSHCTLLHMHACSALLVRISTMILRLNYDESLLLERLQRRRFLRRNPSILLAKAAYETMRGAGVDC